VRRQVSAGPAPVIALLHEHPERFKPLFASWAGEACPYEPIQAAALRFDPGELASRHFPPSARPVPTRLDAGRDPVG
jgi:hypothetical protein